MHRTSLQNFLQLFELHVRTACQLDAGLLLNELGVRLAELHASSLA